MSGQTQYPSVALPPRLPLVITTGARSNIEYYKDARLVNAYLEVDEQGEVSIYKRPGISLADQVSTDGSAGSGLFNWRGDVYSIYASTLFRNGTSVGTGLDTSGGVYRFSSILGATPKLVFGNGAKTYAYTVSGGVTSDLHTLDVDFPATCVKGLCYLNGAMYVMDAVAQIWNSAINSVTTATDWGAANFIAAQMEPDGGVFLAKQLVYLVAMNEWSTEIFQDAGNPTGSPLANVQGSKFSYGCASADSVQRIDDMLFWLSSNESAFTQISMLNQLNHKVISTPAIDRLLKGTILATGLFSLQLKINGHTFYIITIKSMNLTLAYDIVNEHWTQWTDENGNYWPFVASTYDSSRRLLVQHETNGNLYYIDSDYFTDHDTPIVVDIYTPNFDANTSRRKNMKNMAFICDKTPGSVLEVRCSDDDYESWSNFRRVPLDTKKPMLPEGGSFTRRAYHFRHRRNTPFRIKAVDVQYDVGTL